MKNILIIICVFILHSNINAQIITTIAGSGPPSSGGFSGDYGPATAARLYNPVGIAIDNTNYIYISDEINSRIRKIDTNGIITTIAGTGAHSYLGDDSLATIATFCYVGYLNIDKNGNIYIPDGCNDRIRKINNLGIINSIAGNGLPQCTGDGGAAVLAEIDYPFCIAFDKIGNIYFGDGCSRVQKIDTLGIMTRVAGTDSMGGYGGDGGQATDAVLNRPVDIVFDKIGNLYISDLENNVIRKIDTNGIITNFAGTGTVGYFGDEGPATLAHLYAPEGIITDGGNNVFFADQGNNVIRRIDHITNIITTIAGNGTLGFSGDNGMATDAQMYHPAGLAFDRDGNLYIADWLNNRIRKVTNAGVPLRVRGAERGERRGGGVMVFPNPAGKEVTIVGAKNCEVWVYNIVGCKMYNTYIADNKHIIDIGLFAKGFYFVEVVNVETGLKVVNKILKE